MTVLAPLDPRLRMGAVHLAVSDLGRSVDFYARVLGLRVVSSGQEGATLGAGSEHTLVELTRLTHPSPAPPASTGLFHLALLHPDRRALADTLKRIVAARWPLSGASDHGVSEALYLTDPDGLGIEVYVDRPREQWARASDGTVDMYTAPLDIDGLVAQATAQPVPELTEGTAMGHVHLKVSEVQRAAGFYRDALGFDVQAHMPSAAFLGAGGYHHHIGVNAWQSRGAPPAPPTAPGLRLFELLLSDTAAMEVAGERLRACAPTSVHRDGDHLNVHDPDGNRLVLAPA